MKDFFFDYIYFRLQKFYKKWDGDNGITAVIGVSMIQAITFIDVFLIILRSLYSRSETQGYSKTFAYIGVTILIALIIYNHFRFKDRFKELESKWQNEPLKKRWIKGVLVIISLSIPWVVIILLGIK